MSGTNDIHARQKCKISPANANQNVKALHSETHVYAGACSKRLTYETDRLRHTPSLNISWHSSC